MKNILITLFLSIGFILQGQGTEKISNGTFDSSTSWTLIGDGFSIADGVASYDSSGASWLKQASSDMVSLIEDSKTYMISFFLSDISDDEYANIRIYGSGHYPLYKATTEYYEGLNKVFITTPSSANGGGIEFYTYTSYPFDIDSISVIELPELTGGPYFVATDGDDSDDGSISNPWATWGRAVKSASPGDTVYFRAGIYYKGYRESWNVTSDDDLGSDGERGNPISYIGYPPDIAGGDSIVFDCSKQYIPQPDTVGVEADPSTASPLTVAGIVCSADFIVFKGFTIRNVYQKRRYIMSTAFNMTWSNNLRVENCVVHDASGHGFYYDPDWSSDGRDSSIFLNNDAFNCVDSFSLNRYNYLEATNAPQAGSWGNGFMIITVDRTDPDTSSYVQFIGNRAWHNADEGINLSSYGTCFAQGNWSFANGYYLLHGVYDGETTGNGWKVNGGYTDGIDSSVVQNYFYNNIGAYNLGYGHGENAKGVVSHNREVYNNIMIGNEYGWAAYEQSATEYLGLYKNKYVNNVSYGSKETELTTDAEKSMYVNEFNSWNGGVTVTDADFELVDSTLAVAEMKAARKSDGSLPDITFVKLTSTSDLIDAGTDVGIDFNSTAPDLGWIEYEESIVDVDSINVSAAGDVTTIEVNDGTLQMSAVVSPDTAFQSVTWSVHSGTGTGSIDQTGLVQAISDGTDTVRATAQDGTSIYGDYVLTYSNQNDYTVPTVNTSETLGNHSYYIKTGGNVTATGGAEVTARGVCWGSSTNPTLSDNYTITGSGIGSFSITLKLPSPGLVYYVRAYATNSEGTSYGDTRQMTPQFTNKPVRMVGRNPRFNNNKIIIK